MRESVFSRFRLSLKVLIFMYNCNFNLCVKFEFPFVQCSLYLYLVVGIWVSLCFTLLISARVWFCLPSPWFSLISPVCLFVYELTLFSALCPWNFLLFFLVPCYFLDLWLVRSLWFWMIISIAACLLLGISASCILYFRSSSSLTTHSLQYSDTCMTLFVSYHLFMHTECTGLTIVK